MKMEFIHWKSFGLVSSQWWRTQTNEVKIKQQLEAFFQQIKWLFVRSMLIGLFNCNQFDCFWLSHFEMVGTLKVSLKFFHLPLNKYPYKFANAWNEQYIHTPVCAYHAAFFFINFLLFSLCLRRFSLKQFYFSFRLYWVLAFAVWIFCSCICSFHAQHPLLPFNVVMPAVTLFTSRASTCTCFYLFVEREFFIFAFFRLCVFLFSKQVAASPIHISVFNISFCTLAGYIQSSSKMRECRMRWLVCA